MILLTWVCKILLEGFENLDFKKQAQGAGCTGGQLNIPVTAWLPLFGQECVWIQIFVPGFCVSEGLLIPLPRGQDMHRKHREGLSVHHIFFPKYLTGDGLSKFGSGTFTSPWTKAFIYQPRDILLFHQSSPHPHVVLVSDLFLLCCVSVIFL